MITLIASFWRNIRCSFSRSEWVLRLLRLSRLKRHADAPGLVMVQIDGFSLTQFQRAAQKGHMPFLNSRLQEEQYVLHSFYSGLPSNTPNVQGELFYGVKTCVPAFNFMDRKSGQPVKMFDAPYVTSVETQLKTQGSGLLAGGSSYSNIFTGEAKEAHFCWGKMGWDGVLHAVNPLVLPFLVLLYMDIFIKTFLLLVIELYVAVFESIRGISKGRLVLKELDIIWLRVLICVFLREMVVAGACMDIRRGLPVVHLNFLGYDEQAHCRGPSSPFAHWALEGIDDAIKHINHAIDHSPYRKYDLWVYSDHGQAKTTPYFIKYGRTLEDAIKELFGADSGALVTAMGPVGHVYLKERPDEDKTMHFAQRLVEETGIPLVLTRQGAGKVAAWTPGGCFVLPDDGPQVFGEHHPFLEDMKEDIIRMCYHPDAGDWILAGWCEGQDAISLSIEYGAHAGANPEETGAFALIPSDVLVESNRGKNYLRPEDLRKTAENFLHQKTFFRFFDPSPKPKIAQTLRVMSYNVHGCQGMDGFISIDRIARVITRYNPDVIALQELDAGRLRSAGVDQAERIARRLEMSFQFHPAFRYKDEQYGNAILSRYPMGLVKQEALPKLSDKKFYEPRAAIWAVVDYQGLKINIINTHLSVWPREQAVQIRALLSKDWLQHPDCHGPLILCGDMNMTPGSPVYKEICKKLKDSQSILVGHRPSQTWFAGYPFRRIDHIFVTPDFHVTSIHTVHTALAKSASDHLPLIVDFGLKQEVPA